MAAAGHGGTDAQGGAGRRRVVLVHEGVDRGVGRQVRMESVSGPHHDEGQRSHDDHDADEDEELRAAAPDFARRADGHDE